MNIIEIKSRDNSRVKNAVKLASSARLRRETGRFFIEGMRLCTDAAATGIKIDELYFTPSAERRYASAVNILCGAAQHIFRVDEGVFEKLCGTVTPQGIACVCEIPDIAGPSKALDPKGRYAAAENLSDPSNLGTVARTAEALGADGLILCGDTCDPFSPKAQRASMGSLLRLPVLELGDTESAVGKMKTAGLTLFAAVVSGEAEPLDSVRFGDGSVIMIGNEGNGLTETAVSLCDRRVTIPIRGRAESLNAAAAAAILLYEFLK